LKACTLIEPAQDRGDFNGNRSPQDGSDDEGGAVKSLVSSTEYSLEKRNGPVHHEHCFELSPRYSIPFNRIN